MTSPRTPTRPFFHPGRHRDHGLTLVEVLIAVAVGSVMILAGVTISQSTLGANLRLLTAQKLRDNWSKLSLLLNADIAEACSVVGTNGSLELRILAAPESASNLCSSGTTVTYTLTGTTLTRDGPPARADGTLTAGNPPAFLTSRTETIASNVSRFDASSATTFRPIFTLTLTEGDQQYSGDSNTDPTLRHSPSSRTRVRSFD